MWNVETQKTPEKGISIVGIPRCNDPRRLGDHIAAWDALVESPPSKQTFHLDLPGFDERQARVSLLRAAYMVVFAALGYRYILRRELEIVREQIAKPQEDLLDRFSLHLRCVSGVELGLVWVKQPASLRSVMVRMGEHLVILPGVERNSRIYERLGRRAIWPPRSSLFREIRGVEFEWPQGLELAFDQT